MPEPSYLDVLSHGDVREALSLPPLETWQQSGLSGLVFVALIVASWSLILLALARRRSGPITLGIGLGLLAVVVGWGGSYLGYAAAMRVVRNASTAPLPSELASGANIMWWTGLIPTLAFGVTMLAALVAAAAARPADHEQ